jgi:hypothetical protein
MIFFYRDPCSFQYITTNEDELPVIQRTTGNQEIEGILWNFNEKSIAIEEFSKNYSPPIK